MLHDLLQLVEDVWMYAIAMTVMAATLSSSRR